jgi:N6-adenosine-specific RNA methylase IME4
MEQGQKFSTVYADPPWSYNNEASRAAAVNHYPTLSVAEICAEPVSELIEENAHLHLWTTSCFLREALQVIDAWNVSSNPHMHFQNRLITIEMVRVIGNVRVGSITLSLKFNSKRLRVR